MGRFLQFATSFCAAASATILQNGQVRPNNYPDTTISTAIDGNNSDWTSYPPSAYELSYKGRWDDKYISWWTAPGLKFGFTGQQVAITFGNWTSPGVLIATRVDGLDWQLTNVTANSTHLLADPQRDGYTTGNLSTFELRVSNWDYGVQIKKVHISRGNLVKLKDYSRRMELIGDSLSAGQYATLEGIASYSWGLMYGFGATEFSITAYPGICAYDGGQGQCYGGGPGNRGQEWRWLRTADNSERSAALYGNSEYMHIDVPQKEKTTDDETRDPPFWPFHKHPPADITVINLGANDANPFNNVTATDFYNAYVKIINEVRKQWPQTQIIIMNLWSITNPLPVDNTYTTTSPLDAQIQAVAKHFNGGSLNERGGKGFVHYFNTTGILQHNDIGPLGHPTDVADVKLASHLMQYIKFVFGWTLEQVGPEVQHDTLYWNDEVNY